MLMPNIPYDKIIIFFFQQIGGSYIFLIALTILVCIVEKRKIKGLRRAIASFWWFVQTWLAILVVCLFKKQTTWEPIAHTKNTKITDVARKPD